MSETEQSVTVLKVGDILNMPHNMVIQGASQFNQPCTGLVMVTAIDSETDLGVGVIECKNLACGFIAEIDATVGET